MCIRDRGKSNAFLISEKLGIPERVIEAAQQHLSAEDKRLDAVQMCIRDRYTILSNKWGAVHLDSSRLLW